MLRVDEGEYSSVNRGRDLRALIERQRYLCRLPTDGEREALEKGFDALGVKVVHHCPRSSQREHSTGPPGSEQCDKGS